MKNILVLTSGGDAPGMNAAIRAVVRSGHHFGLNVFGVQHGFQGLAQENIFPLAPQDVANCIQQGGTILKTGRFLDFHQQATRDRCRSFLQKNHIDGLVVIGGNGSFKGAALLATEGGPAAIGIPATIDNDIMGSEYTIGFDTTRNTALRAIDNIRDTAFSHDRNFLVEVMGRSSGFLAVDVGIAGGAEFILTPEFPCSAEKLAQKIMAPRRAKQNSIIVIAEADEPGRSVKIAEQLCSLTGLQYRVCILGHIQRGGSPTALDRKIASEMGFLAVNALREGAASKMIAVLDGKLTLSSIPDPAAGPRVLGHGELIELNDVLCA